MRRPLRFLLLLALSLVGTTYVVFLVSAIWVMAEIYKTARIPQGDFAMFWFSGQALWQHLVPGLGALLPWLRHAIQPGIVVQTKPFELSWLYPPPMGLLAIAYALLPLPLSFWVLRGIFFAVGAFLFRRAQLSWVAIVMGLASPAALIDLQGGQNGALTGFIALAALLLLDETPLCAGAIAGLLCIKPQTAIVIAIVVLATRRWRAMAGAVMSGGLLCLLSLPVMGWHGWEWFLSGSRHAGVAMISVPVDRHFFVAGATVFFMLRAFHVDLFWTWLLQSLSSGACALLIWKIWRVKNPDNLTRAALTLSLGVLIVPYGYLYDLTGYSTVMAAMFLRAPDARKPLYGLLWLAGGYSMTLANITGEVFIPMMAALGAVLLWWEMRSPAEPAGFAIPPRVRSPASAA